MGSFIHATAQRIHQATTTMLKFPYGTGVPNNRQPMRSGQALSYIVKISICVTIGVGSNDGPFQDRVLRTRPSALPLVVSEQQQLQGAHRHIRYKRNKTNYG